MFHGHSDYFQKPPLGGSCNTKPRGGYGTPNCWSILILSCVKTRVNRHPWEYHLVDGPVTHDFTPHYYMILEVSENGMGTLSFGLSQFHGNGSWLMCEVALSSHEDINFDGPRRPQTTGWWWRDTQISRKSLVVRHSAVKPLYFTCQMVDCLLCSDAGMSAFCLQKHKNKKPSYSCLFFLHPDMWWSESGKLISVV